MKTKTTRAKPAKKKAAPVIQIAAFPHVIIAYRGDDFNQTENVALKVTTQGQAVGAGEMLDIIRAGLVAKGNAVRVRHYDLNGIEQK